MHKVLYIHRYIIALLMYRRQPCRGDWRAPYPIARDIHLYKSPYLPIRVSLHQAQRAIARPRVLKERTNLHICDALVYSPTSEDCCRTKSTASPLPQSITTSLRPVPQYPRRQDAATPSSFSEGTFNAVIVANQVRGLLVGRNIPGPASVSI